MSTSMTVLLELNWNDGKRNEHTGEAYLGIKDACQTHGLTLPDSDTRNCFWVLDVPAQQSALGSLLHWCNHGGYSHRVRWFFNVLS